MSLTDVRSYFRTRMTGLGHKEWTDAFNFENIPESIQDRSFHMETGLISGNSQNQTVLDTSFSMTLRLFLKGYRTPADAIDSGVSFGQSAICDIINPNNANGVNIKDIQFISMQVLPRDGSNDNTVIVQMEFSARIFLETVS